MPDRARLRSSAAGEFRSLVRSTTLLRDQLMVVRVDGSYIDCWWSTQIPGRYAHHWERQHVDGTIYRFKGNILAIEVASGEHFICRPTVAT